MKIIPHSKLVMNQRGIHFQKGMNFVAIVVTVKLGR